MLHVLYEDNHLIAVDKPAGLPTMGVTADRPSLVTLVKEYLKRKYHKPGNVYLGVVSRLDAPVSGVVVFARTSKAARRLNEQFRQREVEKSYLAVVEGVIEPPQGVCTQQIARDERHQRMQVVEAGQADAKEARLSYRRIATARGKSLLAVELETGRKHQIRLQLSERGHPILGDRKYGSAQAFPAGIALHARRLVIAHPVTQQPLEFCAPPPAAWKKLGLPMTPS